MNKKLMVVAVASALAAPGLALAQASSVTISGIFKVGVEQVHYSGASQSTVAPGAFGPVRRTGNSSETRLADQSSRIVFGIREDLGNGLAVVAQLDQRFNPATYSSPTGNAWASVTGGGSTWVGLQSKTWGKLTFGSHDLHYGRAGDFWNASGAGALQGMGAGLFDNVARPTSATATAAKGGAIIAIANTTRTKQVIRWEAPNWNGFDGTIAWSANPATAGGGNASTGGDLGVGLPGTGSNVGQVINRKGSGWNINPRYTARNWMVEYSYWNSKSDINSAAVNVASNNCINAALGCLGTTGGATSAGQTLLVDDQRSDVLAGRVKWGGFTFGLAWNRSKATNVASGQVSGDRSAWSIPISYTTGPHLIGFNYVKANDSKDVTTAVGAALIPVSGSDTGAKLMSLTYQYSLSKRTALGLSWAQVTNSTAGQYGLFYNAPTAFGGANSNVLAGEKSQLFSGIIRHAF